MPSRFPPDPSKPSLDSQPTDKQVLLHIADQCSELRQLAKRPRLRTVSYLLDMARLEAERMAKDLPD